jgi:hypothetical protein
MSAGDVVNHLSDPVKHAVDVLSIGTLLAALFSWVPAITAVLVLLWTGLRMYESVLSIREKHRALRERRILFEASMRKQYRDTLEEPVPADMAHMISDLK